MGEKIHLGQLVREKVTGLEGVVIGITDWLTGCKTVLVQPRELKDGKPVEGTWFDETRLEVVHERALAKKPGPPRKPIVHGGPQPTPQRTLGPAAQHAGR